MYRIPIYFIIDRHDERVLQSYGFVQSVKRKKYVIKSFAEHYTLGKAISDKSKSKTKPREHKNDRIAPLTNVIIHNCMYEYYVIIRDMIQFFFLYAMSKIFGLNIELEQESFDFFTDGTFRSANGKLGSKYSVFCKCGKVDSTGEYKCDKIKGYRKFLVLLRNILKNKINQESNIQVKKDQANYSERFPGFV